MPELIARPPLAGRAALTCGGVTLSEAAPRPITSIAPFRGQKAALAEALSALGFLLPAPNRFSSAATGQLVWTGRDQFFLIGTPPGPLYGRAALTDQTDGWAALRLDGPGAEAVLARIVPLDVRAPVFAPGHAARVPFNHMSSVLMRLAPESFEVLVFRSMAQTAWHEIEAAKTVLAARGALA